MDEKLVEGLNQSAEVIYNEAVNKGFWVPNRNVGEMLMLVVSELGEALEADRKNKRAKIDSFYFDKASLEAHGDPLAFKKSFETNIKDTFEDEIADAIIRLLDISRGLNIDIERHIQQKFEYNKTRAHKHGKSY